MGRDSLQQNRNYERVECKLIRKRCDNMKHRIRLMICLGVICIFSVTTICSAETVRRNGYYLTYIVKNTNSMDYGIEPYLKKYSLKKNTFTSYGGYYVGKKKVLGNKKRTFRISKKCTYWNEEGVPGGPKKITKKELIKHIKSGLKANVLCETLSLTVKKGKVVKMMIGQG